MTELDQITHVVADAPLFQGVAKEELAACLADAREVSLASGELLLDPAIPNADIFIVLEGRVLVCLEPAAGNPIKQLGVGDCVGELSIIDDQPPSAYVVAASPCRLLAIAQSALWDLLWRQQLLALNLLRILASRIRENNAVIHSSLELRREQTREAESDQLTGLRTRAWADDVFPRQLDLCEHVGQHVSFLLLDIDYFARLNEFYGETAGDEALRHVGRVVCRNLRANDLCARFGGDEVVILMPATEAARARLTAERVRAAIAAAPMQLPDGLSLSLTVSGGLVEWHPGLAYDALCEAAGSALAKAKGSGRNQIAVVSG